MAFVWTPPPPPHTKACVSANWDTNACIKFIFDTAIDDLEWKNPIDFGEYRKTKIKNAPSNFIFDVARWGYYRGRSLSMLAKFGHPKFCNEISTKKGAY